MCLTELQEDQPPKDLLVFPYLHSLAYFCIHFRSAFSSGFGLSSSELKIPDSQERKFRGHWSLRPAPTSRPGPSRCIPTLDPLPCQPHHPAAHI